MNLSDIYQRFSRFTQNNAPALLTTVGVVGTITTAYLTGVASFHAARIIDEEQFQIDHDGARVRPYTLTLKDKAILVWPEFIPAVGTACLTVGAIIAANRVSSRRAAALASAYSLSERALEQYKQKVVQHMGEKKERVIRDEIAQDNFDACMSDKNEIIIAGDGEVLMHDAYSDRYFKFTVEGLKKAVNDTVYQILKVDGFASVNDFYARTPLAGTQAGDFMGWKDDRPMDIQITTVMTPDQRPAVSFTFHPFPGPKYHREH